MKKPAPSELFPSLRGQGLIGFDLETKDEDLKERGPGYHRDDTYIAGVAVGTEAGFRRYYPIAHEGEGNVDPGRVLGWLKDQLAINVPKVGSNILYDLGFVATEDIHPVGPFYDTQVAEPLLDENKFQYGIDALGKDYLNDGKDDTMIKAYLTAKFGKKNPMRFIWRAPVDVAAPYAIADVDRSIRVFLKQKKKLEDEGLWNLFLLETRLIPLLLKMRQRGVRIDVSRAEQMRDVITKRLAELDVQIKDTCGLGVDIWAAASIERAFREVGVTNYPRTPKTKQASFTGDWLELCPHPLAGLLLESRKASKMRGTFLEGQILGNNYRGRVHCQFNQLKGDTNGTVSGRFSCQQPNLQFIPMRTEEGRKIREIFLPEEGEDWGKQDYSQVEYRLAVHDAVKMKLRGANDMARRYNEDPNFDVHQGCADDAGIDRKKAKTINFGVIYGEGVYKLCRQLGLEYDEGVEFLRKYNARVPFMKKAAQSFTDMAQVTGVVQTLLGRKRRFERWTIKRRVDGKITDVLIPHRIPGARRGFTHAAFNARVQGSAADIMKKAMVKIWEDGLCEDLGGCPLITVHDELDWSMPKNKRGATAFREAARIMGDCVKLEVNLKVDMESGDNWGIMSAYEDQPTHRRRSQGGGKT